VRFVAKLNASKPEELKMTTTLEPRKRTYAEKTMNSAGKLALQRD
jgi:hypothetical protein